MIYSGRSFVPVHKAIRRLATGIFHRFECHLA